MLAPRSPLPCRQIEIFFLPLKCQSHIESELWTHKQNIGKKIKLKERTYSKFFQFGKCIAQVFSNSPTKIKRNESETCCEHTKEIFNI